MAKPEPADRAPKTLIICSWCRRILNDGDGTPSHGVCLRCLSDELNVTWADLAARLGGGDYHVA